MRALLEATEFRVARPTSARWWDPDTRCTLVVARPVDEPRLWEDYLAGAVRSYRKHGVERALDMDALLTGSDTALFFAAIDADDQVAGGVRAKGPLLSAEDSHAVVEWEGQPGQAAVRKMINDRVPFGILEMKSAWVADNHPSSRALTKAIARSGFHAMALMDIQFCMATAGDYILDRWKSSGGVVASHIPPTPYPDERYQTAMMWWDRHTYIKHAEPQQVSKILRETEALRRMVYRDDTADGFSADGSLTGIPGPAAEKKPA
jgi:hypothetical protein